MTKKDKVTKLLDGVIHPETGLGLSSGGYVSDISASDDDLGVVLKFSRARDPFAASLARQAEAVLSEAFPEITVSVDVRKPETVRKPEPERRLPGVAHIVAVASGKGGVGKSTVAAHLAAHLAADGYKVGILDADIYGPSQPTLFGVADYLPAAEGQGANAVIIPAESMGVKIMSIGFFISPSDALVWRGPMATNALKQLIRQTSWGELDYLLVDLPPGTGDVHLSLVHELDLDGAIIISTPQSLAIADVRRGVEMFRTEGVDVPILGTIENMAWFTPAELPDNKYYIFGKGVTERFAQETGIAFLGTIPIFDSVMDNGEKGLSPQILRSGSAPYYKHIVQRIVDKPAKPR